MGNQQGKSEPNSKGRTQTVIGVVGLVLTFMGVLPDFWTWVTSTFFDQPDKTSIAASEVTQFKCIQENGHWVTVPYRGQLVSQKPLFQWQTLEFGSRYSPQERCHEVSSRLNQVIIDNNQQLQDLNLKAGVHNTKGVTVVCVLNNTDQPCGENNHLLNLNALNAQNPQEVLAKLANFNFPDKTDTIFENGSGESLIPLMSLVEEKVWDNNQTGEASQNNNKNFQTLILGLGLGSLGLFFGSFLLKSE